MGATLEGRTKGNRNREQLPPRERRGKVSVDQPLMAAMPHSAETQPVARSAKSSANLLCHARAVSVTALWAAIRSSIARRL